METHHPIMYSQELKATCKEVYNNYDTPLQQAKAAINIIKNKTAASSNIIIDQSEWQEHPCNKSYMDIANKYNSRVAKERSKKQEEIKSIKKEKQLNRFFEQF